MDVSSDSSPSSPRSRGFDLKKQHDWLVAASWKVLRPLDNHNRRGVLRYVVGDVGMMWVSDLDALQRWPVI